MVDSLNYIFGGAAVGDEFTDCFPLTTLVTTSPMIARMMSRMKHSAILSVIARFMNCRIILLARVKSSSSCTPGVSQPPARHTTHRGDTRVDVFQLLRLRLQLSRRLDAHLRAGHPQQSRAQRTASVWCTIRMLRAREASDSDVNV